VCSEHGPRFLQFLTDSFFPRLDQFFKRGRRKTEEKLPDLEKDIRRQVEPNCQVDPKFRSPFLYTRMTARAVGKVLLEQAGYQATELPSERTCRLESWKWTSVSYSWSSARRVKRAISSSIVCNFGGTNASRSIHTFAPLQIDLDNGPEQASNRTQFIKRLLEFADRNGLVIELVYYPPYHSKYNSVERCWGILQQHWNGAILNSREAVLNWAQTMTCQRYFPDGTAVGDRAGQGSPSGAERSCSGWNHGCAGCHRLASGAS